MDKAIPKVSVVIPTYNRPALLPEAIRSVLGQTFQDFEIIVVDDGLKERAKAVVEAISDARIRYIQHETNKGCAAAKNTGVRAARGEYVAILDDDDVWLPEKLERQVEALDRAPSDVALCFTGAYETFSDREVIATCPEGVGDFHTEVLRKFSAIHGSMVMYKRTAFLALEGMNEAYPTHTDVEFMIRFTKKFKSIGINEPLVRRKIEDDHQQMGSNIENRIRGRLMILSEFSNDFAHYPHFRAKHTEFLGKLYRQIGDYKNARRYFYQAFRLQPRLIRLLYAISTYGNGVGHKLIRLIKSTK